VVGCDLQKHPLVYLCGRNQVGPLKDLKDQITLAFDAACDLSDENDNGRMVLIADMHGFSASLNSDTSAMKEIAGRLGTVYADRLSLILIVDFSIFVRGIWYIVQPWLTERTLNKIIFLCKAELIQFLKRECEPEVAEKIGSFVHMNRSPSSSPEARARLAQQTSICTVPLRPDLKNERSNKSFVSCRSSFSSETLVKGAVNDKGVE